MYVRRRGLYLPTGTADATDLRGHLSADRDVVAVNREHEWVSLAQDAQHHIRIADVGEHADRAKRSRRQRAKDATEAAKLADLYRSAKSAGARARIRAEMYGSAEMRALRISTMRKVTLVAGLPVLLAFALWSTTGVQAGVVRLLHLNHGDPSWWSAWGVEPALIAIVALIIIGRAVLRSSGGDVDWRATIAEWVALGTSLALNIFGGWNGGWEALGGAVAHSLGPLGAAGTAFLIGLFDSYIAHATPWDGAQRLADLGLDTAPEMRTDDGAQELQLPPDTRLDYAPLAAQIAQSGGLSARSHAAGKPRKQAPSDVRRKAATQSATSGYASTIDPGTQAAEYAISRKVSNREAAQKYGVSEGTVRNRRKVLEAEAVGTATPDGAQPAVPMTPIPAPAAHVTGGTNGRTFTPQETS